MTEDRYVGGQLVIASEPAELNIVNPHTKRRIPSDKVLRLLLQDGTETYGCADCDYTNTNQSAIIPHRNRHRKLQSVAGTARSKKAGEFTVAEVMDNITSWMQPVMNISMDELRAYIAAYDADANLQSWKDRALDAEARLARLQKILGGK